MDIVQFTNHLSVVNFALESIAMVFITFVFFDLLYADKNMHLSMLSETFEKFKRYDIFKSSLIFLVIYLYFTFLAKLSMFLKLNNFIFVICSFLGNIFLILFVIRLYRLIHYYVPKEENKK
jgi:hypothetical protein